MLVGNCGQSETDLAYVDAAFDMIRFYISDLDICIAGNDAKLWPIDVIVYVLFK